MKPFQCPSQAQPFEYDEIRADDSSQTLPGCKITYICNAYAHPFSPIYKKITNCKTPASTISIGPKAYPDVKPTAQHAWSASGSRVNEGYYLRARWERWRHGSNANYLFLDGHVEALTPLNLASSESTYFPTIP